MIILSPNQKKFLGISSESEFVTKNFYLTGGTALAEFYLKHRYSEDLDFFSEKEIDVEAVTIFVSSIKNQLKFEKFELQQSFNRNIYFLDLKEDQLKVEFTYFPFERIEKGSKFGELEVDSKLDIAANKVFSIYQNPRVRDYIDLYFLVKTEKYELNKIIEFSNAKFDWHIDYLKLGTQFNLCLEAKDYPRMIKDIPPEEWQNFFVNYAKNLEQKIVRRS